MDTITTTNLRTKSPQLVQTLKKGGEVTLIHRSKVVGIIKPKKEAKVFSKAAIKELRELAKLEKLPQLSYEERDRLYRKHLLEKYGKDLS